MTTKPVTPQPGAGRIIQFPDAPPEEMTAYYNVNLPGYPGSLTAHFGNQETTVILSEIAAGLFATENREGIRYPDLLISFDAKPDAILPRNGYLIPEQGKPPEFVLEVGSESTGEIDETSKRRDYARFGVPEYWRFDPSGGRFHSTHLAGDRLVGGEYQPITIHRTPEGHFWGHSDALNLDLCWQDGQLRFWDPLQQLYLNTYLEEREARISESSRADAERQSRMVETSRADAERRSRMAEAARADAAEARAQQLAEELRRLRGE